jgi:hypothetical protein
MLTGGWLLLAAVGCCQPAVCQVDDAAAVSCARQEELPVVPRGDIRPDLSGLPATLAAYQAATPTEPAPPYRALSAQECQCLAVAASAEGNLREQERQSVNGGAGKHHGLCGGDKQELATVRDTVLMFSALEARNQSAAKALEYYYQLAEAEAKTDLQRQARGRLEDALAKTRDLLRKGLRSEQEVGAFYRRLIDVQAEGVQLEVSVPKLNSALSQMLGFPACNELRLWPCEDFRVLGDPIDLEAAVAVGLANRAELQLLRSLRQQLDAATLPAVRQVLQAADPLLGMAKKPGPCPLLGKLLAACRCTGKDDEELEARRRQLDQALADRERAVAQEVRRAVYTVRGQVELVITAQERVASYEAKVRDLEEGEAKGSVAYPEVTTARLEWLKARGDLAKEVMAWEIARVDLKKAQGLLPLECGQGPPAGPSLPTDPADGACANGP